MRIATWIWMALAAVALGCGGALDSAPDRGAEPPETPSGGGTTVGTHEGAIVRVDLRGTESLNFADGSRVVLERFIVNLGGVSLLRDLSDPSAFRIDLDGKRLPILGAPGEPVTNKFIIGRDKLQGGAFRGIKLELSPPEIPPTSPDDGTSSSTLFVKAVYAMPTPLDQKGDGAKISPNPAPIEPTGQAAQSMTSVIQLPFAFASRRAEDLLVGLGSELAAGRTVVVVFRANYWFSPEVRSFFANEAARRARLGIASGTDLHLYGQGFESSDPIVAEAGRTLETNILDSIGIEIQ
jgi:hypothetical protein